MQKVSLNLGVLGCLGFGGWVFYPDPQKFKHQDYSNWFKTIEDKTYYHGIQFIGLGHIYQRYDIKLNTIKFSKAVDATVPMIKCRTKDGLDLDLEVSIQ